MNKILTTLLLSAISTTLFATEQLISVETIEFKDAKIQLPTLLKNGEVCRSYIAQSFSNNITIQKICDAPDKTNNPKGLVNMVFDEETGMHHFELNSGRIEE